MNEFPFCTYTYILYKSIIPPTITVQPFITVRFARRGRIRLLRHNLVVDSSIILVYVYDSSRSIYTTVHYANYQTTIIIVVMIFYKCSRYTETRTKVDGRRTNDDGRERLIRDETVTCLEHVGTYYNVYTYFLFCSKIYAS